MTRRKRQKEEKRKREGAKRKGEDAATAAGRRGMGQDEARVSLWRLLGKERRRDAAIARACFVQVGKEGRSQAKKRGSEMKPLGPSKARKAGVNATQASGGQERETLKLRPAQYYSVCTSFVGGEEPDCGL